MKALRYMIPSFVILLSTFVLAQSDAQKSFDRLKTLTGPWEGTVTTFPPQGEVQGKHMKVSLKEMSTGHAVMHEMNIEGRADDPVSMLYLDNDRLVLTHYCDAGNRPRMVAQTSPDGKTLDFEFLDVEGGTHYGHMHHATFTFIDAAHHTEDWTYMAPGDNLVRAHFDLQRAK